MSFDDLVAELGLHRRRKAVAALLLGNDAQCFTTAQYVEVYATQNRLGIEHYEGWIQCLVEVADRHLRSVGMVEVRLGVWGPGFSAEPYDAPIAVWVEGSREEKDGGSYA